MSSIIKNRAIRKTGKIILDKTSFLWAYQKYAKTKSPNLKYIHRALSIPWRSLPDFIIVGAQKSGTTSLFEYICQHPQVSRPIGKEIHFWDFNEAKGTAWYRGNFPLKKNNRITGEATPKYLSKIHIAAKIQKLVPNCKIIIILRNPIDRTFSHYMMRRRRGKEKRSFEDAIKSEKEGTSISSRVHYLQRSIYYPQIQKYFDAFNPNQILILNFNELKYHPQSLIKKCYQFLELAEYELILKPHKKKYSEKITPEMKTYLQDYFKPYNKQLYDFLGINFGWEEQ